MGFVLRNTQVADVGATSEQFVSAMALGQKYVLVSTIDCWFRLAVTGIAAVAGAANNVYLPKNTYIEIKAEDSTEAFISVIRAGSSGLGTANLILLEN